MQKQRRILIGDVGDPFATVCADYFKKHGVWAKTCPQELNCLMQAIRSEHPDMILLPAFGQIIDIEQLIYMAHKCNNVEITIFIQPDNLLANHLSDVEGVRLLPPPTNLADLEELLIQKFELKQNKKSDRISEIELEGEITKFLYGVGIPANLRGFHYLRRAILIAYTDNMCATKMMTEIYPVVAERFQSTAPRVERSIRHAITQAWNTTDPVKLSAYCCIPSMQNRKPTNSELIAFVVDRLHLRRDHLLESAE